MKRRNFVNNCVAERGSAHKSAKAKTQNKTENKSNANDETARPATTGQAPKAQTTGQTPKAQ
jgi:hypothetical protein